MNKKLEKEIVQVKKEWRALKLRTMDKAPLTARQLKIIARGRLNPKSRKFRNGGPIILASFKASIVETFLREAHGMHRVRGKSVSADRTVTRRPLERLSPRNLRKLVATEFRLLAGVVSGREQKRDRSTFFERGLFRHRRVGRLHCDAGGRVREAVLVSRLGNLPTGLLKRKHPEYKTMRTKDLIRRSEGGHRRSEKAREKLWARGVIESGPLGAVIFMTTKTKHCSFPVPKRGAHSVFMRCFFLLKAS